MAPGRGKGKAPAATPVRTTRRRTRSKAAVNDGLPDVFHEMLADAEHDEIEHRPLKRPKVAAGTSSATKQPSINRVASTSHAILETNGKPSVVSNPHPSQSQTIEESSEDSASEFEFEDVDLDGPARHAQEEPPEAIEDLSISIQPETTSNRRAQLRRKPVSFAEKSQRLFLHKMHFLCLLAHCMYVNGRCNGAAAQKHLRSLLTSKTISYLNPKINDTQFQRNRSFMDGLQQAVDAFTTEFRITVASMRKPRWDAVGEDVQRDFAPAVDNGDFISAAQSLQGSQDMANQLFCALLRSAGVEARLVCSLQVLPFTTLPKQSTPKKPVKSTVLRMSLETPPSKDNSEIDDAAVKGSATIGNVPSVRRRLGNPSFVAESSRTASLKGKEKPVPKLTYPIFWVEAFNEASQKWISVDPMVTGTINKATKLEPPSSNQMNQMVYVIALESDGVCRDVTKRYSKAYNAKTRRHRVEVSAEGNKWFRRAIRFLRRRGSPLDRDQVEDTELAQKEAREGMPANVQDFKDHPYYALERHMKRHEVIHPKREVGKVNAGTAANPRMESVYRRQDVFACKSADKWYRLGREIKTAEQPLKHIPARSKRQLSVDAQDEDEPVSTTALYAPYQTQLYVPPPIQRGMVPKNMYGNLDVYTPSMVPAGGTHIRHEMAQTAAKLLKIDYADAVTGFKFQGRRGTAVIEGAVVANQYADAVWATIEGFENEIVEEKSRARSLTALRLWKHFLTGLRIAERVSSYGDPSGKHTEVTEDINQINTNGFSLEFTADESLPTAGQFSIGELTTLSKRGKPKKRRRASSSSSEDVHQEPDEDSFDGIEPDDDSAGGFIRDGPSSVHEDHNGDGDGFDLNETDDGGFIRETIDEGEGFLPERDGGGGGFMPEPQDDDATQDQVQPDVAVHMDHTLATDPIVAFSESTSVENTDDDAMDVDNTKAALTGPGPETDNNTGPVVQQQADVDPEDESDKGSLLSHDPEDDDAEPDWLESD